jgi:hypothetical protein
VAKQQVAKTILNQFFWGTAFIIPEAFKALLTLTPKDTQSCWHPAAR